MNAEGIIAVGGVLRLERVEIDLAVGIVAVESFLFDAFPVVGRYDRTANATRDRSVAVFGFLHEQPLAVATNDGGFAFFDDFAGEIGRQPRVEMNAFDAVKIEKRVGLAVVGLLQSIPLEDGPIPQTKVSHEGAEERLVIFLV